MPKRDEEEAKLLSLRRGTYAPHLKKPKEPARQSDSIPVY